MYTLSLLLLISASATHIPTPAGMWPEECVHTLPSGTKISHDAKGVHYGYPNGTKGFRPPCTSKPQADLPRRHNYSMVVNAVEPHGYPLILWGNTNSPVQKFTAYYNVPEAPATYSGQTVFWWLGVESSSASDVLQPVLGYGQSGAPGWTYTSWNCCPSGHQHNANTINVNTGDLLFGSLDNTGGDGYTVLSQYGSEESVLHSNDEVPQVLPLLSMEVYNADCSSFPTSCMKMTSITTQPSMTFSSNQPQGFSLATSCGWSIRSSSTSLVACPPGQRADVVV